MKLNSIIEKKEAGKWFEIPGDYFEKLKARLLLKPISQDEIDKTDAVVKKFNKKTHLPYEELDKDKQKKNIETLLFESVGGWEGMEKDDGTPAELTRENWDLFITNLGRIDVGMIDKKNDYELTLSGWISFICLNPRNFFDNDLENL